MKRQLYRELVQWKNDSHRKPLILLGIRQVGKTWLLKEFGRTEFEDCAYFNFEADPTLAGLFEGPRDPNRLLQTLALLHGKPLLPQKTLIVLDEIQECPDALNALKYFAEQAPDHPLACAGSLLGVGLCERVSFPVGKVAFLMLRPLTFREFIEAAEERALASCLAEATPKEPVPAPLFARLVDWLKTYFVTGGLPEPAADWIAHRDFMRTENIQRDMLRTYELDFGKHVPRPDIAKVRLIWDSVPSHLARENKKFVFAALRGGARAREYEQAINWLEQAGLVIKVRRVKAPALPLASTEDPHAFKLYFPDVGLLRTKAGLPARALAEGERLFKEFRGALTENFVLQELLAAVPEPPRYWTSQATAEVDFVVPLEGEIFPLEAKAGVNVKAKSLRVYCQAYRPRLALRASMRNLRQDGAVLNVPLFLVSELPRLCRR